MKQTHIVILIKICNNCILLILYFNLPMKHIYIYIQTENIKLKCIIN